MFVYLKWSEALYHEMFEEFSLNDKPRRISGEYPLDQPLKEFYGIDIYDPYSGRNKIIDYDKFLIFQLKHGHHITKIQK